MKHWREGVNGWHLYYDEYTGKIVGRVGYNSYDDTAIAKFNDNSLGEIEVLKDLVNKAAMPNMK